MKNNIRLLIFLTIFIDASLAFSQGYEIEFNFYSADLKTEMSWDEMQEYWKSEINEIEKKIENDSNNADLFYRLAIAKENSGEQDALSLIKLLDKAILLDSEQAKYYAVRGIIKYNWGAYSQEYDIGEGCIDIKRAIELGLLVELKNNASIKGILYHPSCKR